MIASEDIFELRCLKHDGQLRSRVKLLGTLLGNVIREEEGANTLSIVEKLRRGFIALRQKHDEEKLKRLVTLIARLTPEQLVAIIRAFNIYFQLVNIAEESFHHRQRRRIVATGSALWGGSFDQCIAQFHDDGISISELKGILAELNYYPVFTAHPTEARRRIIISQLRRIFEQSEKLDQRPLGKTHKALYKQDLQAQIKTLWKTNEVRTSKLQVTDEIRSGLQYFKDCLFDSVPEVYRRLERAVCRHYSTDPQSNTVTIPSFLTFGSWIGGDRDGNPFVTPETTRHAIYMHYQTALERYLMVAIDLKDRLTQSNAFCTPNEAFANSLAADEKQWSVLFEEKPHRYADEPYRRKLYIMAYRLRKDLTAVQNAIEHGGKLGVTEYQNEQDLLNDLYLIRDSLYSHNDFSAAEAELKDFVRQVETFGFHLAHLDIRQESNIHSAAVAEILNQCDIDNYADLSEQEKLPLLGQCVAKAHSIKRDGLSKETTDVLAVFDVMAELRHYVSPNVFGSYVISMTHQASHIMEVLFLGSLVGLAGKTEDGWFNHLSVSPLFETIEDLEHTESVLSLLFQDDTYTALLQVSGNLQEIMLGYSDSAKDGGIMASAWNLYKTQQNILKLADDFGIQTRLFHGRGGTMGRGGGPTHEAIRSQPQGTVRGQIKFTEQGEVLTYKYSNKETAVNELTMGSTGLMLASQSLTQPAEKDNAEYLQIMQQLTAIGEQKFRQLTENEAGFLDYFYEATPVTEIGLMNIGSRPSHRKKSDRSKSSVRAIAWVFGWAQSRHTLPAWYGIGSALQSWLKSNPDQLETLRDMYQHWPFFKSLISNTQMSLFKGQMDIAKEYAELCEDPATTESIFALINEEYQTTVQQILEIADISNLLEETPVLRLSLERRDPYLDPLNHIQLEALRRYRDETSEDDVRELWLSPLLRSINAISAGMRNTG